MSQQGTLEWKLERVGKFSASRMSDLLATTKSGPAASRKNYLAELLVERMTGEPTEGFTTAAMQWGIDKEPEARALYELSTGLAVEQVGFILHPAMPFAGASPDGLVGADGGLEIKCPNTATHIETLRTGRVPEKYLLQMQWGMACTGRQWWDFVSYDPRMKDVRLQIWGTRIQRDDQTIAWMESEVAKAEAELCALLAELESKVRTE